MIMALFKRRHAEAGDGPDAASPPEDVGEDGPDAADEAAGGPWDVADRPEAAGLLDFGAVRLPMDREVKVTVEVSRETGRPVSVVVAKDGSRMQLTAFAAPRSGGLAADALRDQISAVAKQGGTARERAGRFGVELVAQVPTTTTQGRQGKQVLRFIWADGPRWMLRGVIGGKAARDEDAAAALEDLFAGTVVVRGSQAMPPRESLPLSLPTVGTDSAQAGDGEDEDPTALLERGPEITEVR
jgi:hypothetical protein